MLNGFEDDAKRIIMFKEPAIRLLTEEDIDDIIVCAGGQRFCNRSDMRKLPNADYIFQDAAVELKILCDEALIKEGRKDKLSQLFSDTQVGRPVKVIDKYFLSNEGKHKYDRILEGPIKTAVAKAKKQLRQTRTENSYASASVLFIVNNGYSALSNDDLMGIVRHRVQNDTKEIDGVVVAGCYYHSDGFDNYFLWPIDYIPIKNVSFNSFGAIQESWNEFAGKYMTDVVLNSQPKSNYKNSVCDLVFDNDGTTFVKIAPPIGGQSAFYAKGRPRKNTSPIKQCPPVAILTPRVKMDELPLFFEGIADDSNHFKSIEVWKAFQTSATKAANLKQPHIQIDVEFHEWHSWCAERNLKLTRNLLDDYITKKFSSDLRKLVSSATQRIDGAVVPSYYILCITEVIGQDKNNDISHIYSVVEKMDGSYYSKEIALNLRIFHEHALALACSYAIKERVSHVMWYEDFRWGWC